jgi:hypothetical protein
VPHWRTRQAPQRRSISFSCCLDVWF